MSRNSSGTYTLPSGNPVVTGTLIESNWANNTLSDLATAMTDSLSRSGQGGMTFALRGVDGTNTTPAYSYTSETSSGFYRAGAGDVRLAILGTDRVKVTASGMDITGALTASGTVNFNGTTVNLTSSTAYYPQQISKNTTADANASYYVFDKDRNGSIVQNSDVLGNVVFRGYDGANYLQGASINAAVDGTPGTNDMPTKLVFATTGDGESSPTQRMAISSAGTVSLQNDYQEKAYTANTSTGLTISLANGTIQILTLTATTTLTMPTAVAGKSFVIYLKQDGTGSRTVTWTTVKWPGGTAPTITSTASKMDIYSFFSDGTNWYGVTVGQNYTP